MKKITITLAAALLLFAFVSPAFPQGNILDDAEDFVFFADFVIGSGWTFQIAISNNSPTTYLNGVMGVAVDATDSGGVSFKEALEAGFLPSFTLPPGGTKIYTEWPNVPLDEVIRGGVLVVQLTEFPAFQTDTQMMSAVLTYRNDETKTEITVPPVRFKDLIPPFFNRRSGLLHLRRRNRRRDHWAGSLEEPRQRSMHGAGWSGRGKFSELRRVRSVVLQSDA